MKIGELMTPDVEVIRPEDTLHTAARMMADLDAGVLPVAAFCRSARTTASSA